MSLILDLLDRPIAFQRTFVRLGVGIAGALMLSQSVYWSRRTKDADGWFYKSREEWEEETGLTRAEQERARKALCAAGVFEEVLRGVPAKLHFRVLLEPLEKALINKPVPADLASVLANCQATLAGLSRAGFMRARRLNPDAASVSYADALEAYGMVCGHCGKAIGFGPGRAPDSLGFGYKTPLAAGGEHDILNLRPVHVGCAGQGIHDDIYSLLESKPTGRLESNPAGWLESNPAGWLESNPAGWLDAQQAPIKTEITAETTADILPATPEGPLALIESHPAPAKQPSAYRLKLAADREAKALAKQQQAQEAAALKDAQRVAQADLRKDTWAAFDSAYSAKYGTTLTRNATTNSQMAAFVGRIGQESPGVAAFYVRNVNDAYIVRNTHSLGLLVSGAESYRTQWATGQAMTNTRAQQADKTQSNFDSAQQAKAMLRARREQRNAE